MTVSEIVNEKIARNFVEEFSKYWRRKEKMADKRFILEVNESQLKLVKAALEEYFRIRMNQWNDLSYDLASTGVDFSQDNPNHEKILDIFFERRDCVKCALEAVGKMVFETTGYANAPKTHEQLVAEDIWQVIRYALWNENHKPGEDEWCVDSRPPMNCSGEPLPKCWRKEE